VLTLTGHVSRATERRLYASTVETLKTSSKTPQKLQSRKSLGCSSGFSQHPAFFPYRAFQLGLLGLSACNRATTRYWRAKPPSGNTTHICVLHGIILPCVAPFALCVDVLACAIKPVADHPAAVSSQWCTCSDGAVEV
jgi:hypothetical protein